VAIYNGKKRVQGSSHFLVEKIITFGKSPNCREILLCPFFFFFIVLHFLDINVRLN